VKYLLALIAVVALTCGLASAQDDRNANSGYELGVEQLNNSGQVGTLTLFNRGPRTSVAVSIPGKLHRAQWIGVYRGYGCPLAFAGVDDLNSIATALVYSLKDLRRGSSISTVPLDFNRLVSGNYTVVIFSSNEAGARPTACGHLYQ
jgi:hypothetical protein